MSTFSKRLIAFRNAKEMSINQVAKKLGVSPSTYRTWEYGASIKGEPYVELAKIFDVSLNELLTGEKSSIEIYLTKIEDQVKFIRSIL